jgi:hypothetical protein
LNTTPVTVPGLDTVAVAKHCVEGTVASGLEKTELAVAVDVAHGQEGGTACFGTALIGPEKVQSPFT